MNKDNFFCWVNEPDETNCQNCRNAVTSLSFYISGFFTILKGVVGIIAGSQALLADAFQSLVDSVSLGINYFGLEDSDVSSEMRHLIISAVIALITFGSGVWVIADNISALLESTSFRPGLIGIPVSILSIITYITLFKNSSCASARHPDIHTFVCKIQNRANLISSSIAFGGILLAEFGFTSFDSISALLIGGLMVRESYEIYQKEFTKHTFLAINLKDKVITAASIIAFFIIAGVVQSTHSVLHRQDKVLIPSDSFSIGSKLSKELDRSNYFLIIDRKTDQYMSVINKAQSYKGDVSNYFMHMVKTHGVGVVVAKRVGHIIFDKLHDKNVEVYYVDKAKSVYSAYMKFKNKQLTAAPDANMKADFKKGRMRWFTHW